jgi:hypothetical protein
MAWREPPETVRRLIVSFESDVLTLDAAMRAIQRAAADSNSVDAILRALIDQLAELRDRITKDYYALRSATEEDAGPFDDHPQAA